MTQNGKKPLSTITFRISDDINPKTLEFINEYFIKGQLPNMINNALKLYCNILAKNDILEHIRPMLKSNSEINRDTRRKPKKPNDIIGFRLDKDVSADVLKIINEYWSSNKLAHLVNVSLEFYRIIYELTSTNENEDVNINKENFLDNNKPPKVKTKAEKSKEINKSTKLSYKLLQSFKR